MTDRRAAKNYRDRFLNIYSTYLHGDLSKEEAQQAAQTIYNEYRPVTDNYGPCNYDFDTCQMYIDYTLHELGVVLIRTDSLYDRTNSPYYRGEKNKKRKHLKVQSFGWDDTDFELWDKDVFVEQFTSRAACDAYILKHYGSLYEKQITPS